jgi:glycolate oxidase FAD binding subunit
MTVLKAELAKLAKGMQADPIPGAPPVELTVAPADVDEAASILRFASNVGLRVLFWGGGTHQDIGNDSVPDVVMTTRRLNRIVDWQAEDLTVVVEAGVALSDLEAQLQQRGQTAVLPETPAGATVGGVVAAGLSGWRRLRYGPTRDRVLEVVLATGDGRIVRGGGPLVKNVTGYDLPRLATGSLGSLGLIARLCLKLWPLAVDRGMVDVADPELALRTAYRPLAVIETDEGSVVYLAGTSAELQAQAKRLGGRLIPGHRWPEPLAGSWEFILRVPAGVIGRFVDRIRAHGWSFQAAHGVGEVRLVVDSGADERLAELRKEAELLGGALVTLRSSGDGAMDPWGAQPGSVDLQRRVKAAFDPAGIANPGILPGGI